MASGLDRRQKARDRNPVTETKKTTQEQTTQSTRQTQQESDRWEAARNRMGSVKPNIVAPESTEAAKPNIVTPTTNAMDYNSGPFAAPKQEPAKKDKPKDYADLHRERQAEAKPSDVSTLFKGYNPIAQEYNKTIQDKLQKQDGQPVKPPSYKDSFKSNLPANVAEQMIQDANKNLPPNVGPLSLEDRMRRDLEMVANSGDRVKFDTGKFVKGTARSLIWGDPENSLLDAAMKNIITNPLGTLDKLQYAQPVQDYIAGSGDIASNMAHTVEAFGGDKVPILKDALEAIDKEGSRLSSKGGTSFWSKVMRSAPQSVNTLILALATGGASIPAQLGGNATLQTIKNTITSPTFMNTLVHTFGGAYDEARKDEQDRPTAITKALIQSIPESIIEQSGGLETIVSKLENMTYGLFGTALMSALEEGLEEILQYPLDALSKIITYAPETPWYSTTETAVINPPQMLESGAVGLTSGGLFGGGTQMISDIKSYMSGIQTQQNVDVKANDGKSQNLNFDDLRRMSNKIESEATQQQATEQQDAVQPKPQETAPVKTQEQELDEAIKQQQGIVDDLSYRKFYLEHDVEAELETEAVKLEELKAQKEKLLQDRKAEGERAQRAYDYEQGNISLEQIMSESEVRDTKTDPIPTQEQADIQKQESTPVKAEPVTDENRGSSEDFKSKHESKFVETDKNVWEMDADEYYDYISQSREVQTEGTTAFDSGTPQSKIEQDIKAIEDRYYKNIDGYTKALYHQNNIAPPRYGYEYRDVPFQDKIDKFRAEQESLMEAEKQKAIKSYSEKAHKTMISDAVNAGLDVPDNILQKYPYLKKKYDIMKTNKQGGAKNEAVSTSRGKADAIVETGRRTEPDQSIQGERFIPQKETLDDSVAQLEAAPTKVIQRITGNTIKAYDNDNKGYEFKYAVVSADDLIASHDTNMNQNPSYPQELQPRDRERIASKIQVDKMAVNIQPELLGESPKIQDGAPIIGGDNVVESGNGRVIALKKMYQATKANKEKYVNWLKNNADKFGIDVNNMPENPVLVRVRQTDVDRNEFAKKANEASVALMSSTETAKSDAERLTDRILGLFEASEDGTINTVANRPFIAAFTKQIIPSNEVGKYITPEGYLSQDGLARVRNAIFYKAYGSDRLLTKISESTDNNIKNITNSLINVAPKIIKIKDGINRGVYYDIDYSADIIGAVEQYLNLKNSKLSIDEYLQQELMFDDGVSASSKVILSVIDQNSRSAKKVTEFLNTVLEAVEELGNPDQVNLFGEQNSINKDELIKYTYGRFDEGGQQTFEQITKNRSGEGQENKRVSGPEDGRKEAKGKGEKREEVKSQSKYSSEDIKNITGHEDVLPTVEPISDVPSQFRGDTVPELDLKSERGAITLPGKNKQQPASGYSGYSNPDIEKAHQNNRLKPETLPQKIMGFFRELKTISTRTFPLIDASLEENAVFMQEAVRFPKIRRMAMGEAARILRDITLRENTKLNKDDFNIFERVVFMQDLLEDNQNGLILPNGWDSQSLNAEWNNVQPYINSRINAALNIRKQHLDIVKENYIKALKGIGHDVSHKFNRDNYFRHQVLEYMQIKKAASSGTTPDHVSKNRGWSKTREGTSKDINTDYLQAEYEVLFGMINDTQIAEMWKRIYDKYDLSAEIKKNAKNEGKDWREMIPEGYAIHQPFEGNYMFNATSIPDQIVTAALQQGLKDIGVPLDKVRTVLAKGQKRAEYVIPKDYIATMKNYWSEFQSNGVIDRASKFLMSQWKATVLTRIPTKVIKYNIRNLSGDVDSAVRALGVTAAASAKYSFRAASELYNALRYFKFTQELLEFRDLGGLEDNIVVQEIAMISKAKEFKDLTGTKNRNFFKTWDQFSSNVTQYRENLLRYATYLAMKDTLSKSPNGLPKNYGASLPGRIKGLRNIQERAYQMTNDAIGNYSEVTVMGRWLRNNIFPFWSFKERNIVSTFRVIKNAANEITESDGQKIAKGLGLATKVTGKAAIVIGKTAVKLFGFTVILGLMNMLNPNDDDLPEDARNSPHLTLWKGDDGQIRYFTRLGSMTDILEWVGLDTLPADIKDLKEGKTDARQIGEKMLRSPLNMIYSMLTPYIKTPIEIMSGQTRYPDVFSPRMIRDNAQYTADQLGFGNMYKYIAGKPIRENYISSLENAFLYRSDPKESAYYMALDLKRQYQQQVLKEKPYYGGAPTERANALYYYKLALKYGDEKAAKKYYEQYSELVTEELKRKEGKKPTKADIKKAIEKGIESSLNTLSPTYGLSKNELASFISWLQPNDRDVLKKAMTYYKDVVGSAR